MYISKSDFLIYKQCPKHFWLCKRKPEVCENLPLSDFEKQIIEQGNEVESWARKLFPQGIMVETKKEKAVTDTKDLLAGGNKTIFQATFLAENLYAMIDVWEWDELNQYWIINEVKGSSSQDVKKEDHLYDATFQKLVAQKAGYTVGQVNLIELNKEFRKDGDISPSQLLTVTDISAEVDELEEKVLIMTQDAQRLLDKEEEPRVCECLYKSRKNHCPSFAYSNPEVPDYSVHDIARIGSSKKKLREIVDNDWLRIEDIPLEFELSRNQANHVHTTITGDTIIKTDAIQKSLSELVFPLYFLDYETFPTAIPVFEGCYPYQQVPFQYSLHRLDAPDSELIHTEYLHPNSTSPLSEIAHRLRADIGDTGSVIVWNQKFEKKCNEDLGFHNPALAEFFAQLNGRVYDLMEIFSKQLYVHKDFRGSSSIKYVLPVLVPEFSYSSLNIQDGGMALSSWKKMVFEDQPEVTKQQIHTDLLAYCELDTLAMVKIWEALGRL